MLVKTSKTVESSNALDALWHKPLCDDVEFFRLRPNAISVDEESTKHFFRLA